MTNRGHWLEAAVSKSNQIYMQRGLACLQKIATPSGMSGGQFYRAPSTVDFLGSWRGRAVAFDCKSSKVPRLDNKNVKVHQRRFLANMSDTGAIAGLLVAFEKTGDIYFVTSKWYENILDELDFRASIPEVRFETGDDLDQGCWHVPRGTDGSPISYGVALERLLGTR